MPPVTQLAARIALALATLAAAHSMALAAAPLLDYTRATAAQLQSPAAYVEQARAATPMLREP